MESMWPTGKFSRVCWEAAGEGGVEKLFFYTFDFFEKITQ